MMTANGCITEKMKRGIQRKNCRQGVMKLNRKLHKTRNEDGRYPWRAHVSGIGTATEMVAGLVEYEMTESVKKLKSFVADLSDFLRQIKGMKLGENEFMFSMDVVAKGRRKERNEEESGAEDGQDNSDGRVDGVDEACFRNE
jgi:hypothetical protein